MNGRTLGRMWWRCEEVFKYALLQSAMNKTVSVVKRQKRNYTLFEEKKKAD